MCSLGKVREIVQMEHEHDSRFSIRYFSLPYPTLFLFKYLLIVNNDSDPAG